MRCVLDPAAGATAAAAAALATLAARATIGGGSVRGVLGHAHLLLGADFMSAFNPITQPPRRHYTRLGSGQPRHLYWSWNHMQDAEPLDPAAPVAILLENHRAFLRYLERRVGDRALAEDILQDAFARVMDRPDQAPADEGVVPWFYRTLRNAAIDQFRRRGTASRAIEAFAREIDTQTAS